MAYRCPLTRYSVFCSHSCGLATVCTAVVEPLAVEDVGGAATKLISDCNVEIRWPMFTKRWGRDEMREVGIRQLVRLLYFLV